MKLFKCQRCAALLYFENTQCTSCAHRLGYLPQKAVMSALESEGDAWRALAVPQSRYRLCANAELDACNWLIPAESAEPYCIACRHNHLVPDLAIDDNLTRWRKLEAAKHRMFYGILALDLPLASLADDPATGLVFDVLAGPPSPTDSAVITGHENGRITVNLAEADDAERERVRQQMAEPYRTLLGHFRHEIGHYYWDRLVRDAGRQEAFRAQFGDERLDYQQALADHSARGPAADWQERFVSSYASMHPWEDFAETWAHYLHIVDTLEMAGAFGLRVHPRIAATDALDTEIDFDPYRAGDVARLVEAWLPLTFAVNSLNRSMGQPDLYPFRLTPVVIAKLGFVHDLVHPGPSPA
jgi:hypothetical protein